VLLVLSFLWFVCNVAALVASMNVRSRTLVIDAATILLAFCFPPTIMHVSWAEVASACERPLARGWRLALWPAYAICL
jgi:hypothetical protein